MKDVVVNYYIEVNEALAAGNMRALQQARCRPKLHPCVAPLFVSAQFLHSLSSVEGHAACLRFRLFTLEPQMLLSPHFL